MNNIKKRVRGLRPFILAWYDPASSTGNRRMYKHPATHESMGSDHFFEHLRRHDPALEEVDRSSLRSAVNEVLRDEGYQLTTPSPSKKTGREVTIAEAEQVARAATESLAKAYRQLGISQESPTVTVGIVNHVLEAAVAVLGGAT